MQSGRKLILKKLSKSDFRDVWNWRNDPASRRNSTAQKRISWKEHQRWLRSVLKDRRNYFYLVTQQKKKLGVIRFDYRGRRIFEISINMNPEYRGQGFGKKSLSVACERMKKKFPNYLQKAVIKEKNKASESIFSRAGFLQTQQLDKGGRWLWIRP